jgi:cyclohexa-1,5-dienecarbonyl-CoA hydratase
VLDTSEVRGACEARGAMTVLTSFQDGVATLTLAHPPLNILTQAVLGELRGALRRLEAEPSLKVVILGAQGRHFSAGADVGEHLPPNHLAMIPEFLDTISALAVFPLPVVAAVHGRCLGGGFEMVQAADVIVAGAGAVFGQPEILLGVTAPAACVLLPRRVPAGLAAGLLFTGDTISAPCAHDAGLVYRVVDDEQVDAEALALAHRMARHSAAALRLNKWTLRACAGRSAEGGLREAGRIYLDELMHTRDAAEGLHAFLDKREPVWSNR